MSMKVINAEISEGSLNQRTLRVEGLVGGIITFESDQNIPIDAVVSIEIEGEDKFYRVAEASTIDGNRLEFSAVEYGYFINYLSHKKDFDLRKLLGLPVEIIADENLIGQLITSNNWC